VTWQAALTAALASGETEEAARIVLDEVLSEQRHALGGHVPALAVRGFLQGGDLVFAISGPEGGWQVERSLLDLANRARANPDISISLLGAVAASAIGRDRWGEEEWLPYGYIGAGSPPEAPELDYLQTDRDVRINAALDSCDLVLVGRPASGKTASAAEAAKVCRARHDDGVIWLDLTDPFDNAETVMLTLLRSPARNRFLVVVDNLQANASAAMDVLRLVQRLREEIGLSIRVLATCWSSATALIEALPIRFTTITADGGEVVQRLIAETRDAGFVADVFDRLASGDLVLAKAALQHFRTVGRVPQPRELATMVATRLRIDLLTDVRARRALYWFACMNLFEIGVYRQYCADVYPDWPIADLRRRGLIRLDDEMYTIGHPSTASAIVNYANDNWSDPAEPFPAPSRLAFEYLRRAGKPAVQATLEKLDLVNHGRAPYHDRQVLARVWPHRGVLARNLRDQALERDHTWGGNVASAAFAAAALALLDEHGAWRAAADFVRGQWAYDTSHELPREIGAHPSADAADFVMLRRAMIAEDRQADSARSGPDAENIDFDRFYRTWMLGILLTFENTAVDRDRTRTEALIRIADRHQLRSGAFYPERVPWITARVLNGLWHGNLTRHTSRTVSRACDWLRRPVEEGGPFDGRWHSGTGTWNTDVMTTAMCITALIHAGVGADDACVRAGYRYLKQEMPRWRLPGREIDCAAAAEAILLAGPDRTEIYPVVTGLLEWVERGEDQPSPDNEESAKITYIAEQVIWIVQRIIEQELEALPVDFDSLARGVQTLTAPLMNEAFAAGENSPGQSARSPVNGTSKNTDPTGEHRNEVSAPGEG
jgi:hypothetical protein